MLKKEVIKMRKFAFVLFWLLSLTVPIYAQDILYLDGQDAILYNLATQEQTNLTKDFDLPIEKPVIEDDILVWLTNNEFYIKDLKNNKIQTLTDWLGEPIFLPAEEVKPSLSPDGVFLAYEGLINNEKAESISVIVVCIIKDELTDYDEKLKDNSVTSIIKDVLINYDESRGTKVFYCQLVEDEKGKLIEEVKSPVWFLEQDKGINNLWLGWLEGRDGRTLITSFFAKKENEEYFFELSPQQITPFYKEYGFSIPKAMKTFEEFTWAPDGTLYVVSKGTIYKYSEKDYAFKKFINGTTPQFLTPTQLCFLQDEKLILYDTKTKEMTNILPFCDWYDVR